MRTLAGRAKALYLLLALLGGGFGLPLYDGVVYHARRPANDAEGSRLADVSSLHTRAVATQSHSSTCALSLITLAGRGSPGLGTGILLAIARTERALLPLPPVAPAQIRTSSTRSRAPPAVTA